MKKTIAVLTLILVSSFLKAQELKKVYYDNGKLQAEGKIENGKQVGLWKAYHENGTLAETGNYDTGIRIGNWNFYYDNGKLQAEGKIENGKQVGLWKQYYENGTLGSKGNYEKGKKIGDWNFYYDNGKLQSEGKAENGKKVGLWKEYHENGKLASEVNFNGGKKDRLERKWDDNGNMLTENYYKDGTLKESLNLNEFKLIEDNDNGKLFMNSTSETRAVVKFEFKVPKLIDNHSIKTIIIHYALSCSEKKYGYLEYRAWDKNNNITDDKNFYNGVAMINAQPGMIEQRILLEVCKSK